jgi:hypothetical protein
VHRKPRRYFHAKSNARLLQYQMHDMFVDISSSYRLASQQTKTGAAHENRESIVFDVSDGDVM